MSACDCPIHNARRDLAARAESEKEITLKTILRVRREVTSAAVVLPGIGLGFVALSRIFDRIEAEEKGGGDGK